MFRTSQDSANGGYRVRPSKGAVMLSTPIGLAILVYGIVMMLRSHHPNYAFVAIWAVVLLAILGFNLWAAFGKRGSLYRLDKSP